VVDRAVPAADTDDTAIDMADLAVGRDVRAIDRAIPAPSKSQNHFFGQILFKLADNVYNGKNGIPLFLFFF
jgi:hypothetical protein